MRPGNPGAAGLNAAVSQLLPRPALFREQLLPGFDPIVRRVALQCELQASLGDEVGAEANLCIGWFGDVRCGRFPFPSGFSWGAALLLRGGLASSLLGARRFPNGGGSWLRNCH